MGGGARRAVLGLIPSVANRGDPSTQATRTSICCVPFRNSTLPCSPESSIHQPATGTPASTGRPVPQVAYTVPAAVANSPVAEMAFGTNRVAVGPAWPSGADDVAAATCGVPLEADASSSETARKPRPTAAAADAAHATPRTRGRRSAAVPRARSFVGPFMNALSDREG